MIYTHVFRFRNVFSLADRRRSHNIYFLPKLLSSSVEFSCILALIYLKIPNGLLEILLYSTAQPITLKK